MQDGFTLSTDGTVAEQLGSFVAGTAPPDDPALRERAALHLLDALGCGLAAVGTETAGEASAIAAAQGGRPDSSVLGESARVPAAVAAFANGARCHGLDFDDTHEPSICHASVVVAPAALAVGEAHRRTGAEVLAAYAVGCEVTLRIGTVATEQLYERGFHPTSVCGAFGAAAAASRLMGLDERRTTMAFGIVGSFAAGLFEFLSDGAQTKPLHAGAAAQAGVQAAQLAAEGATGPATVIEGRFGLLASHGVDVAAAAAICDGLGTRWSVGEMSLKPYPACHWTHSTVWGAAQLARDHGLVNADIGPITVRIPPPGVSLVLEPLVDKHRPTTPYGAKFSLPYCLAHHLVHGGLGFDAFAPDRIADPDVLALAARVDFEELGQTEAANGSRFAGGVRIGELDLFVAHTPGSPGNPLTRGQVLAKFRANAELALDAGRAAELAAGVAAIADADSLDGVMDATRAAAPSGKVRRAELR